ncbi:MAG TPA: T9SS type A sorting domain-containing protein [Ignavibacteria bacterium]|nr:T9SS type A sorting domain-containing protein [Ignavibacteria bacterium]
MKKPKFYYLVCQLFLLICCLNGSQLFSQSACKIDACNCCGQEGIYYELLDSVNNVIGSWYSGRDGCHYNIGGTSWPEGATYHIRTYCPNGEAVIEVYITGCVCGFTSPYQMVDLPCCPTTDNSNMNSSNKPKEFILKQNYPNPFNPVTKISFELPESSNVTLTIYDAIGKVVIQPISGSELKAGFHEYIWNASQENIASGIYFYKLEAGGFSDQKKMILVK